MSPRFAQIAYQIDRVARPISGKAELRDKRRLRQWVAEVTGRQVPSSSQFNEAIPSKAATKVAAARKELETLLSQNK